MSSQEPEIKFSHSRILTARLKPNFKRERKIGRRLFTSSFKREIRKLHKVVHVKETAKKCTKKCDASSKLMFYLLLIYFLFFFLCSRCILRLPYTFKRCSASGLNCRYLTPYIKLKLIELWLSNYAKNFEIK